jgi:hypothetical protein
MSSRGKEAPRETVPTTHQSVVKQVQAATRRRMINPSAPGLGARRPVKLRCEKPPPGWWWWGGGASSERCRAGARQPDRRSYATPPPRAETTACPHAHPAPGFLRPRPRSGAAARSDPTPREPGRSQTQRGGAEHPPDGRSSRLVSSPRRGAACQEQRGRPGVAGGAWWQGHLFFGADPAGAQRQARPAIAKRKSDTRKSERGYYL